MKLRPLFAAFAFCAGVAAQASPLPAHPFVSTSGKAQLWMQPDFGELKFEIGAQHASAETASTQLLALSAAIAQCLAEFGIQDEDVESFDVDKKTVEVSGREEPAYTMGRYYRVRVRDLAQWPAMLHRLMAMDHIANLSASFDRSDSDAINSQLMASAATDARGKATQLAQAFGRKLGPVVAIARGPLDKVSAPYIEQKAGRETSGTPAQQGKYTVPASIPYAQTVNAIFVLK